MDGHKEPDRKVERLKQKAEVVITLKSGNRLKPADADHDLQEKGHIKRLSGLVEEVCSRIRADIMSLKIPPGARISVDNLARELGVSQTPIREALSMLEARGLVTKKYLVGYCSAPKLNRRQFEKLYDIRLVLEPHAAGLAALNMPLVDLQELDILVRGMDPGNPTKTSRVVSAFCGSGFEVPCNDCGGMRQRADC